MTSYPDPLLPTDQIPPVALDSMNRTHREEVELINDLAAQVAAGMAGSVDERAISERFDSWLEHTRRHFAREQSLMEQYAFPAYPVHLGEHERVLTLLEDLQRGWHERKALRPLADFLFEEWREWFDHHVQTMDNVTASFILRQKG